MEIATELLDSLLAEAAASPGAEICGLLFGDETRIVAARACRNVHRDAATRFEIDPAALLSAHRAARGGGPAVIGCYHSHPSGRPAPSPTDAAAAAPDGMIWLIVADGDATAWRAVAGSPVHDRFLPVGLRPSGCASGAAPAHAVGARGEPIHEGSR